MKHLNTYKIFESESVGTRVDISKLRLIDPFELSYFKETNIYFYNELKMRSHSYDDNWGWAILYSSGFKCECGYIIFKNNEPFYVVGVYEPRGFIPSKTNAASQIGGLVTILGYETLINLWLDYDEYEATRIDSLE